MLYCRKRLSSGRPPTVVPGHPCGPSGRLPHLSHRVFHDVLWIVGDRGVRRRQGHARRVQASEQVGAAGELLPAGRRTLRAFSDGFPPKNIRPE